MCLVLNGISAIGQIDSFANENQIITDSDILENEDIFQDLQTKPNNMLKKQDNPFLNLLFKEAIKYQLKDILSNTNQHKLNAKNFKRGHIWKRNIETF